MSYDLAVWVDDRLGGDPGETYLRLVEPMELEQEVPPSPAIEAFVAELLARWPDLSDVVGDESPWAYGPLRSQASGDIVVLNVVWSRAADVAPAIAAAAAARDLLCYDCQSGELWPNGPDEHAPDVEAVVGQTTDAMRELGVDLTSPVRAEPLARRRRWRWRR